MLQILIPFFDVFTWLLDFLSEFFTIWPLVRGGSLFCNWFYGVGSLIFPWPVDHNLELFS